MYGYALRLGLTDAQHAAVQPVTEQAAGYDAAFVHFDEWFVDQVRKTPPTSMGGPRSDAAITASLATAIVKTAQQYGLLWPPHDAAIVSPVLEAGELGQLHNLAGAFAVGSPALGVGEAAEVE